MDLEAFLEHLNSGKMVQGGSDAHLFMHGVSQEALRITAEINGRYHEPEELRALFSQLIGRPVDESFGLFPPFYTDCGKNIHIGKRVFIINNPQQEYIILADLQGSYMIAAVPANESEPLSDVHIIRRDRIAFIDIATSSPFNA